jgi:hypothetical protein
MAAKEYFPNKKKLCEVAGKVAKSGAPFPLQPKPVPAISISVPKSLREGKPRLRAASLSSI